MELGQAETLRVLYQHDGGVGDVDAYLDHRGGHEHVDLAVSERPHGGVTLLGLHPSVYQAHFEGAQIVAQPFGHGGRSLEVHFLRLVDYRIHDIRLPAGPALLSHELVDGRTATAAAHRRLYVATAGRLLPEGGDIQVAIERHGKRARDRCGRQQQHVRRLALLDERRPLFDPEPVLLVDHHQSQPVEGSFFLEQGVGTHDDSRGPTRDTVPHGGLLRWTESADQEFGYDFQRSQEFPQRPGVLLGEQLCGGHEHSLAVILHRQQHGEQGNDRLARANVSHQQTVHPLRGRHVSSDFANHPPLPSGQLEWECVLELGREVFLQFMLHAFSSPLGQISCASYDQLHVKQLVVGKPAASPLGLCDRAWAMNRRQGVSQAG